MMVKIDESERIEMSRVAITAKYQNEYILVEIVENDHSCGKEICIPLYRGDDYIELGVFADTERIAEKTMVMSGLNRLNYLT